MYQINYVFFIDFCIFSRSKVVLIRPKFWILLLVTGFGDMLKTRVKCDSVKKKWYFVTDNVRFYNICPRICHGHYPTYFNYFNSHCWNWLNYDSTEFDRPFAWIVTVKSFLNKEKCSEQRVRGIPSDHSKILNPKYQRFVQMHHFHQNDHVFMMC